MQTFPSNIERTFQMFPTFTHWSHCEKDAHELTMYSTCNHQFPGPLTPSVMKSVALAQLVMTRNSSSICAWS